MDLWPLECILCDHLFMAIFRYFLVHTLWQLICCAPRTECCYKLPKKHADVKFNVVRSVACNVCSLETKHTTCTYPDPLLYSFFFLRCLVVEVLWHNFCRTTVIKEYMLSVPPIKVQQICSHIRSIYLDVAAAPQLHRTIQVEPLDNFKIIRNNLYIIGLWAGEIRTA